MHFCAWDVIWESIHVQFIENILTSTDATVKYIDCEGKVVFEKDKRSKQIIEDLLKIHRGIKDAFKKRQNYGEISYEFAEELVDIIRQEYSEMHIIFFANNNLLDEFCNRKFDLNQFLNSTE